MASPSTRVIVIGAGFAGAATAAALAERGQGPGLILERETTYGVHASGRNAGLLKVSEDDAVVRTLAVRSARRLDALRAQAPDLVRPTGGLTLYPAERLPEARALCDHLQQDGIDAELVTASDARERFALLRGLAADTFAAALWCAREGVVDVHALLTHYLKQARAGGVALRIDCPVLDLAIDAGRVVGVVTPTGVIRADTVVDATGAWAGRLGRPNRRLPLAPVRRHLFLSAPVAGATSSLPFVWAEGADFYLRGEGDGLLLSPCDATPAEPGLPSTDPAAAELLADKLARHAPGLGNLAVRRYWACLRTFTPDRRPCIGPDPERRGLFHVSGLGGYGVMTSAAVGELAAALLAGETPDWIDASAVDPARAALR